MKTWYHLDILPANKLHSSNLYFRPGFQWELYFVIDTFTFSPFHTFTHSILHLTSGPSQPGFHPKLDFVFLFIEATFDEPIFPPTPSFCRIHHLFLSSWFPKPQNCGTTPTACHLHLAAYPHLARFPIKLKNSRNFQKQVGYKI